MDKTPEERIGINETEVIALKESDEKQWQAITKLQNRPPIWATAVISLLTFLLGCSLTYAGLIVRLGK